MSDPPRLVRAYTAASPIEAHFLRALIEREQIPVQVVGENLSGGFGELPASALQVELFVASEDLARAREIVSEYESRKMDGLPPDGTDNPWDCTACGETVDGTFEVCWNCQSPRPAPPNTQKD